MVMIIQEELYVQFTYFFFRKLRSRHIIPPRVDDHFSGLCIKMLCKFRPTARTAVLSRQFSAIEERSNFVENHQVTLKGVDANEYPIFLTFDETPYVDKIRKVFKRETYTATPSGVMADCFR